MTSESADKLAHEWVIAAYVPVDAQGAAYARRRGVYRVPAATKVSSAEVMCGHCRRPYDEAVHTECPGSDPALHGGPIGTRKRRTPDGAGAQGPTRAHPGRSTGTGHTGTLSAGAA